MNSLNKDTAVIHQDSLIKMYLLTAEPDVESQQGAAGEPR